MKIEDLVTVFTIIVLTLILIIVVLVFTLTLATAMPFTYSERTAFCEIFNFSQASCMSYWDNFTIYWNNLTSHNSTTIYLYNCTNQTVYVNQTIYVNQSPTELEIKQAERDHEFRMRQLELNCTMPIPVTYNKYEIDSRLSDLVSRLSPPVIVNSTITNKKDVNYFSYWPYFLIAALIFYLVYRKFFSKKSLSLPLNYGLNKTQNERTDVEKSEGPTIDF